MTDMNQKDSPSLFRKINSKYHYVIIGFLILVISLLYYSYFYFDIKIHSYLFHWFRPVFIFENIRDFHGSLFYIPLFYSVIVLRPKNFVATWVISFVIILPLVIFYHIPNMISLTHNLLFLLIPFTFMLIISIELNRRDREKRIMIERENEQKVYTSKVIKAQELERKIISQEIHDGAIQDLLGVANRAQQLILDIDDNKPQKVQAEWIRDTVMDICGELRKISIDLRPSVLDTMGLIPAVKTLLERFEKETNIQTKIVISGEENKFHPETESTIFRVIQEALNNIKRHSGAKNVEIIFEFSQQILKIQIKDNGKGFLVPPSMSGFVNSDKLGLVGMQYRAELLGGNLAITSEIDQGTVVTLNLKLVN